MSAIASRRLRQGRRSSRTLTIALVLLLAGCRPQIQSLTPTAEPAAIPLAPYASEGFAIRGVVPRGWAEFKPGWYAPAIAAGDQAQTALAQVAYPRARAEWGRHILARLLNLAEPPEKTGARQTASLAWDVYSVESGNVGAQPMIVDTALAELDGTLYLIILQAPKRYYDALHKSVFLPAVDALEPVPVTRRDRLTADELMAADSPAASPVHNRYFTPLGDRAAALHRLEGTLTVPEFKMQSRAWAGQTAQPGQDFFPGFSARFFTHQDFLVPVSQDILPAAGKNSAWRVILSPGQVWSEPGDGGLSRAAFPFVLVAEDSNETHNGLATFLFDDIHVSSLRFQVIQETAAWNKRVFWGHSAMQYLPGAVDGRDAAAARFAEEISRRMPVRPWSELEAEFGAQQLASFTGATDLLDISATGLVLSDTLYLQACLTAYGEYPYCPAMRHGPFSVTKSMGAAVAMLRLAQKYGQDVFDLKISDYAPLDARHNGWKKVTFGDALNMATGIGDYPERTDFTGEENERKFFAFMEAKSAADKLAVIATYGQYPWGPGSVARYNSINTFMLSVAMDRFLKTKEGPQADIWDMVVEEVYEPIGIYHAPIMRTIEPDGSRGVPIFGYGLYPTVDDVAKVALLLQSGGRYQGYQILHAGMLAQALGRAGAAGLPTGQASRYGEIRYGLAFWSMPYRAADGEIAHIPYMSGYGGNLVVLSPNGVVGFRFADGFDFDVGSMAGVAAAME